MLIRGEAPIRGGRLFQCGHPKARHLLEEIRYYKMLKFKHKMRHLLQNMGL